MRIILILMAVAGWAFSLTVSIMLIVKFWRACNAIDEMNHTVQLMAYDLKDLRDKAGADKIIPAEPYPPNPNPAKQNPTGMNENG